MAKPTVDSVRKRSEGIHRQYVAHFAGQARATRDLSLLERLIDKALVAAKKAHKLKGKGSSEVRELTRERLKLYRQERDLVAEAQLVSPHRHEANALQQRAWLLMSRYARHFGGKPRPTRDRGLLDALLGELRDVRAAMQRLDDAHDDLDLSEDLEAATSNVELLSGERQMIGEGRADDETVPERLSILATRANGQLRAYTTHFAGRSRASRDPAVLDRIVAELEDIGALMAAEDLVAEGGEDHERNRGIVAEQLEAYRAEREALAETLAGQGERERAGALGAAANDEFELYKQHFAGKDRNTRDLELLGDMCDRLAVLERAMVRLDEASEGRQDNRQNLTVVRQQLRMFEEEWGRIAEAQGKAEQQRGAAYDGDPLAGLLKIGDD